MKFDRFTESLKEQSPLMVLLFAAVFVGKVYLEKKITSLQDEVDRISSSSLEIKTALRSEERQALVEFHQALTEWEHHLISGPYQILTADYETDFDKKFQAALDRSYLKTKLASSKLSVLVSDRHVTEGPTIDSMVYDLFVELQKHYYPPIYETTNQAIDLHLERQNLETEIAHLAKSTPTDPVEICANNLRADEILKRSREINQTMLDLARKAQKAQLIGQQSLPDLIESLKARSQQIVYRKLQSDQIGED